MHRIAELDMGKGDINGLVCRHIDGFDVVHGVHDVGRRDLKGRMLLELCLKNDLLVSITLFMERDNLGDNSE